jgi:hypothetical protein
MREIGVDVPPWAVPANAAVMATGALGAGVAPAAKEPALLEPP